MIRRSILYTLIALAITGLISGCAVLTVDVDVYKGPLANHEHVLTEQTAVMAIGAKPLLNQLNQLLKNESSRSKKEQSKRVEAVLGLYKDRFENIPKLKTYITRADDSFARYQNSLNIVDGKKKEDKTIWENAKKEVKNDFKSCFNKNENKNDEKKSECLFVRALEDFFVPREGSFRRARHLVYSYIKLSKRLAFVNHGQPIRPNDGPTTAAYAYLAQENNAKALTEQFLKNNESEFSKMFADRLIQIARSFADARRVIVDIWRSSLEYMIFMHGLKADDLNLDQENSKVRTKMTVALAALIAVLTDVEDLVVAICLRQKSTKCQTNGKASNKISKLHEILVKHSSPDKGLWTICLGKDGDNCDPRKDWPKNQKLRARIALESALIAEPKEMANLLLDVDDVFRNIPNEEFQSKLPQNQMVENLSSLLSEIGYDEFVRQYKIADYRWDYYCDNKMGVSCERAREYGIVRVPNPDLLEELQSDIRSVKKAGGVGLDTGRLPQGLDTLIEEYLRAAKRRNNKEIKHKRTLLLNALVRFAEKVLFIANHEELLNPVGSEKQSDRKELNKYVLTLQAIGNAIIVQVDELVRRQSHRNSLVARTGTELQALQSAANPSASEVISEVLEDLSNKRVKTKEDLDAKKVEKKKADKKVASLQENLEMVTEEESRLKGAKLTAANELRSAILAGELEIHAWQTLSGELPDILGKLPPDDISRFDGNKVTLKQDADMFKALISDEANKTTKTADIRKEIIERLGIETPDINSESIRHRRLTKTKELFEKLATNIDQLCAKCSRSETFKEIKNYIERQYQSAEYEISEKRRTVQELKMNLEAARKQKQEIDKVKADTKMMAKSLEDEMEKLKDQEKAVTDSIAVVQSVFGDTLSLVSQAKVFVGPATVFRLLRAEIAKRAASATIEEAQKYEAKNALKVLAELPVPLELFSVMQGGSNKDVKDEEGEKKKTNQIDVLDAMIAKLRYALIQVEGKGDTSRASDIKRAIKAALAQRAGMAYIRPSSAFLRSSYASTGLQSNPGLAWRNMLEEHGERALSSKDNLNAETKNRVIKEIDKQFWQNINKVRVAGGGDTNYVLAKDDVGNWYVKSYQTNRESIFKSARNLALFGAGARLDLNLLERMELEEQFREQGSSLDSAKEQRLHELRQEQARAGTPKALSDVYEKFKTQYNASTEAAHAKLMSALAPSGTSTNDTKLGNRIIEAWNANGDAVIKKEHRDRLAADLRIQSDALLRRYKEMADLQKEKKEKDNDEQPSSKDTMARKQATQIIDTMRSIADFEAGMMSAVTREFSSALNIADVNKATTKASYEKQKMERESLEIELTAAKTEFENKRSTVLSIEKLEQADKDKTIDGLRKEEEIRIKSLENQIKTSKSSEGDLKQAWDKAVAERNAVRRAVLIAKTVVSQIAGKLFREILEERQQAVREYERAITYIGNIPSD